MKYPEKQYKILVESIRELASLDLAVEDMHPSNVHYLVYKQYAEGQDNNSLYRNQEGLVRPKHMFGKGEVIEKVFKPKYFELYPDGCDDSHVATAVRKAVKEVIKQQV